MKLFRFSSENKGTELSMYMYMYSFSSKKRIKYIKLDILTKICLFYYNNKYSAEK